MSESRYLLSFTALLAGALVLCAPLILLQAIADPDNAWLGEDPLAAAPSFAGHGWDTVITMNATAQYDDTALPPAVPLQQAEPAYTVPVPGTPPSLAALTETPPSQPYAETVHETAAESVLTEVAPKPVEVAELDAAALDESGAASVTYTSEPAPQHQAQEPAAEPVQVAELDDTEPDAPADDAADDSTSSVTPAPDAAPPLPARRPAPTKTAEIVVTQARAALKPAARAEQKTAARLEERHDASTPRWKPMALAPADKPAPPKISPSAPKISSAAYQSQIWSQLARHKPRAGQRGSATVTFSIGANGGLRGARVAKSSGNAKIDQMALATVRNAAPFAPPPNPGTASYTIRIDIR
ncbi:MAG: TonB family protein [Methyloceanibacter sp.]